MIRCRAVLAAVLGAGLLAGCAGPGVRQAVAPPADLQLTPELSVQQLWRRNVGSGGLPNHRLRPVRFGDRLVVAGADGRLLSLQPEGGDIGWEVDLDQALGAGPAAGDGLLAVGTRAGEVVALDPADGSIRWTSGLTSEVLAPPAIGQGLVVARSNDGRVFALEQDSGERRWLYDRNVPSLSVRGYSAPVLVSGGVLVGFDNGRLEALDLRDGTVAWEASIAVPSGRSELERMVDIDADPQADGGEVFAASYQGRAAAVSLRNGRIQWAREMSVVAGLAVDSSFVYLVDAEGSVWCLDRFSGASVWRQQALQGTEPTAPVLQGEWLVVGAADGHLSWLSTEDGRLLQRASMGAARIAVPPVVDGDRVYVQDLAGRVAAWRALSQ